MSKDLIGIARSRSPALASRKGWVLGVLGLACGAACSACGESDGGPVAASDAAADTLDAGFEADVSRPDAEAGTDAGPDVTDAADAPWDGKPDGCDAMAPHPAVPEGWERWNGWSCDCPLFLPGTTGQMPPPIEWEPCEETVTAGLSCRRMKHTWNETSLAVSIFPKMGIDPTTGAPLLAFGRLFYEGNPDVVYRIVAEADGPVRNAFMKVNPAGKGCGVSEDALREGKYVFWAHGDTWDGPLSDPSVAAVEGIIAGTVGDTYPETVLKLPGEVPLSNWSASARWLVQSKGTRTAWSWDLKSKHTVYDPATDPDHLPGWRPFPIGEDVMVEVGDGRPAGVMTWNVNDGLRPLIRWYGDVNQAAGNFGTDGKDMVWTYVAGKDLGGAMYETMSVMTAPFSTSAAEVETTSRRLRSDVKGFEPYGWVVGCGYAARGAVLGPPNNNALYVVRLADGHAWLLPGKHAPGMEHWGNVLGITCDELFATMDTDLTVRILRFRLDSLGPGTPPD